MIFWRDYLAMLREDGVELARSEDEALDDDGNRQYSDTLVRFHHDHLLHYRVPALNDPDDPVSPALQRRIMNVLRLPPERYAFGRL